MYTDILHCLRDADRRKCLEKWRINSWFLLHDNAPAHQSVLVEDFLSKNVTTLKHPPYSPDMAAADFYLLPQMKSALKGRYFCDCNDVIKQVTDQPKKLL
jgi:histone-lysine N-methyltransferase SETMAR